MDIKILKHINGSLPNVKGDTTLAYTDEIPSLASNICESYSDSGSRLSPDHSTFLSLYSPNEDLYTFVHIQAQQWIFEGGARKYAYRGGFAVSRATVERLNGYKDIVNSLPRIADAEKMHGKTNINSPLRRKKDTLSSVVSLTALIEDTMARGQYLYIVLDRPIGKEAKGDGLFDMEEFQMLLAAIDGLNHDMRQYATFSFLADVNFAPYLKETAINVCTPDCGLTTPKNSATIKWSAALKAKCKSVSYSNIFKVKAGEPLMTVSELLAKVTLLNEIENSIANKQYHAVTTEHWQIWQEAGHSITEVKIDNDATYDTIQASLPQNMAKELSENNKPASIQQVMSCLEFLSNESRKDDAETKLMALSKEDFDAIISTANEQQMKQLFHDLKSLQKDKQWNAYIDSRIYLAVREWINSHYNLVEVQKWPDYCKALEDSKSFKAFVVSHIAAHSESNTNIANKLLEYTGSLDKEAKTNFAADAQLFIKAFCKGIEKEKRNEILVTLYPEKVERCKLLKVAAVSMFIGIIIGIGMTCLYYDWMGYVKVDPKTEISDTTNTDSLDTIQNDTIHNDSAHTDSINKQH